MNLLKFLVSILIPIALVGGLVGWGYFNLLWVINLITGIIDAFRYSTSSHEIAVLVVKFLFRGIVVGITFILFQIPTIILGAIRVFLEEKFQ